MLILFNACFYNFYVQFNDLFFHSVLVNNLELHNFVTVNYKNKYICEVGCDIMNLKVSRSLQKQLYSAASCGRQLWP